MLAEFGPFPVTNRAETVKRHIFTRGVTVRREHGSVQFDEKPRFDFCFGSYINIWIT